MRSFWILRSVDWSFLNDISAQPVGPIFKVQADPLPSEDGTDILSLNVGKKPAFCAA